MLALKNWQKIMIFPGKQFGDGFIKNLGDLKYKKKPAPKNIEDRKLMVKKVRKFGIKKA